MAIGGSSMAIGGDIQFHSLVAHRYDYSYFSFCSIFFPEGPPKNVIYLKPEVILPTPGTLVRVHFSKQGPIYCNTFCWEWVKVGPTDSYDFTTNKSENSSRERVGVAD